MNRKPAFDMLQCTLCAAVYAACAFVLAFAVAVMVTKGGWTGDVVVALASAIGTFSSAYTFILVYLHLRRIPARY